MTHSGQLQRIVTRYRESCQPWPATAKTIAAWALDNNLWAQQRGTLIGQCAEELSRAMREEYITDPQGRTVRAKHVAMVERDGVQLALWADIRTADRDHMEIALQQRRRQIVGDCRQLKIDADSFNENGNPGQPIQLVFNFEEDLRELELLESIER